MFKKNKVNRTNNNIVAQNTKKEKKNSKKEAKRNNRLLKKTMKLVQKDPVLAIQKIYTDLGKENLDQLKAYWDDIEEDETREKFEFMEGIDVHFTSETMCFAIRLGGGKGKVVHIDEIDAKFNDTTLHDILMREDREQAMTDAEVQLVMFHVHMYVAALCIDHLNDQMESGEFAKAAEQTSNREREEYNKKKEELAAKKAEFEKAKSNYMNEYQDFKIEFFGLEYKAKVLGKDIMLIKRTQVLLIETAVFSMLSSILQTGPTLFEVLLIMILMLHSIRLMIRICSLAISCM